MTVRLSHRQKPDTQNYVFQALGSPFSLTGIAASLRAGFRVSIPDKIPYIYTGYAATVSKLPPVWGTMSAYSITATTPVSATSLPVTVPGGGSPYITVAWHSSSVPSSKPSWVTLTSGTAPTIAFTGDANQIDSADVSSMVLSAAANGSSPVLASGVTITVSPSSTAVVGITYNQNEGTVNNGSRNTRGEIWYESGYTTKHGTIIEAFDGAHTSPNYNRVGEFDPDTRTMTEVFPNNWDTKGVTGYDNQIYCYFDKIDSLVVFVRGVYDRSLDSPANDASGYSWKYSNEPAVSPTGRPPMYTTSTSTTAFAYQGPSVWIDGFNEHIGYYNVATAYSNALDTAVIIGGASGGGPIDLGKLRLSIFVPSSIISSSIVAPYSVIHRTISSANAQANGKYWMLHETRAGCVFLGNYVYWCGGADYTGTVRPYLFRANVANIVSSSDPINAPFTVENLADAPVSFSRGALTADPYSNTLTLFNEYGVYLYDVTANSWSSIIADMPEYVTAFSGRPYLSYPHAAFVDQRLYPSTGARTTLRKSYFFGGWNNNKPADSIGSPDGATWHDRFSKVRSVKYVRAPQTWAQRSTASGVLWAHDFSESDAEVEQFTYYANSTFDKFNGTNLDPTIIPNVIKRVAGAGINGGYALRTKLVGNTLTQATPSGVQGDSHVFHVSNAADFPDPTLCGQYTAFVGDPSDKNVCSYEEVVVTARNVGANTLTVTRRAHMNTGVLQASGVGYPRPVLGVTYTYPNCAPFPVGWTIGMNQGGEWRRPLVPLAAVSNGKAAADIGTTNGSKRAGATYQWSSARANQNHYYFRRGHFGAPYYWDTTVNPSAKWATQFVASDYTANAAQGNIFEGDEFYLQFRVKCSANLMSQFETKVFYIHNTAIGSAGQIFMHAGLNKWGEVQYSPETIPGVTYGHVVTLFTQGGDGRAQYGTQGYVYDDSRIASGPEGINRWQTDYPATGDNRTAGSFCWPGDTWVTFMLHCKFGRDQAENMAVDTSPSSVPPPYPAATNPSYRTTVELFVHLPGWTDYKKLIGGNAFTWWFGDGIGRANYFPYHAGGLNSFWMTPFSNLYADSGGEPPHPSTVTIDYAQVICSKKPIVCPSD